MAEVQDAEYVGGVEKKPEGRPGVTEMHHLRTARRHRTQQLRHLSSETGTACKQQRRCEYEYRPSHIAELQIYEEFRKPLTFPFGGAEGSYPEWVKKVFGN